MASPTDLRKSKVINYAGTPHLVCEVLHRTQGRQAGFVQTVLRNLKSGSTTTVKFRSTETVEILHTENRDLEFTYKDREGYHFSDPDTSEELIIPEDILKDQIPYLTENQVYSVFFVGDKPAGLELPSYIEAEVVEAPEGVRGNTATAALKTALTSNGLTVQVPLFVQVGDLIQIKTEDGSYRGRVN